MTHDTEVYDAKFRPGAARYHPCFPPNVPENESDASSRVSRAGHHPPKLKNHAKEERGPQQGIQEGRAKGFMTNITPLTSFLLWHGWFLNLAWQFCLNC